MLKDKAVNYFMNGYSCSEAVLMACIDENICPKELLPCATSFSGGMSSGCVCGAVAAAQIVIGYNFGRENLCGNDVVARQKAAEFVSEFKNRNKVTCCRVLSANVEPANKKAHCSKFVVDACEILEELIRVKV